MEATQKSGKARGFCKLFIATSPRKPPASEIPKEQNEAAILNEEYINRWAEYLKKQLSWPAVVTNLEARANVKTWQMNVELPAALEDPVHNTPYEVPVRDFIEVKRVVDRKLSLFDAL
ncbi:hypothetical protein CLF_107020 [Clonorchis sinensis]|uniref:Uncharacterized protein n=1 Tax=Clonorchis sinensis TaxID=79923 RepID=G7YQB4_CLOSI|nr:hypothetical protein CLF_107020 [Clonorchis sinensis]